MSSEANKAVVRRFYDEVVSGGRMDLIAEMIAPNWVNHDPSLPPFEGVEGARQLLGSFPHSFPDFQVTYEDLIAEGDRVSLRQHLTGTQQGEFMGIPATGRSVAIDAMAVHRVVDGKITDNWVIFDALGLMQQLGVLPPPNGAPPR
jgi:steroid delta-isomerase-like uncharacterized protein